MIRRMEQLEKNIFGDINATIEPISRRIKALENDEQKRKYIAS